MSEAVSPVIRKTGTLGDCVIVRLPPKWIAPGTAVRLARKGAKITMEPVEITVVPVKDPYRIVPVKDPYRIVPVKGTVRMGPAEESPR